MASTKNTANAAATNTYNYQQKKAEFLQLNNNTWDCLGVILFEELIARLCERPNNIPDILCTLHENRALKSFKPAISFIEKTLDCKSSQKTVDNVTLYAFTFNKNLTDTKAVLLSMKDSFKGGFLNAVFSLVEQDKPSKEFTIAEALKRLMSLQRKCGKHKETSELSQKLEAFIKSLS